jgi:hypothetical protein
MGLIGAMEIDNRFLNVPPLAMLFCMQLAASRLQTFRLWGLLAVRFKNEYCMPNGGVMVKLDFHSSGRHFLQIPGPSPVPDRILRAMSLPTIDHRGPEFGALGLHRLSRLRHGSVGSRVD